MPKLPSRQYITTKASSTATDNGTGADSSIAKANSTIAANDSCVVLSSVAEDFPYVQVNIFYVKESLKLTIDCLGQFHHLRLRNI
ncbi:hypothetical protein GOP47_0025868 [Adiantum capillus-veneris]|uniref:Uncharacterized protein n=1 Tax=Adiantum capillus-veneris TaxID=13818 RepID=A0A9D4U327_ADICA|nr:hypothetical protein GOP47_0025868 [Adiantum capillus-veneris]